MQVVEGLARACRENGCALLGGETAEMPGFYADGEYDLAGFIVGVVRARQLIDGKRIAPGDVLIGLPSSGLHTNGYSLARRIVFDDAGLTRGRHVPELGATVGDALLAPHRSYLPVVRPLLGDRGRHQGHGAHHRRRHHRQPAAHPAAGHAPASIVRVARAGPLPWLQRTGGVPDADMLRAFNMGIGLIVVCAPRGGSSCSRSSPRSAGRGRRSAILSPAASRVMSDNYMLTVTAPASAS